MKGNPPAVFNSEKYTLANKSKIYIINATCIFLQETKQAVFFLQEPVFCYIVTVNI